jgi:hypothetical protein
MADQDVNDVVIVDQGLRVRPQSSHIGASVDGLLHVTYTDKSTEWITLEVKCPFSAYQADADTISKWAAAYPPTGNAKNSTQCYLDVEADARDGDDTVGADADSPRKLRKRSPYWWQVICQLFCFHDHPKYQVSRGIFGVWVDGSGRTDHANVHVEFIDYATFQGEWEAAILKIDKFYFNILLPEIACPTPKGVTPRDMNQHVLATGTGEYRTWPMSAKSIVLTTPEPELPIILVTPARESTSGGIGGEASRIDLENSETISRPSKRPRLSDNNPPIVRSSSPVVAAAAAKESGSLA